jgi:hypothetical protein
MIIPMRSTPFSKDECMLTSHGLLLKFWHDSRYVFSGVGVEFVDRGAPGDRSAVSGRDIRVLDAYYFEIVSEQGVKYILTTASSGLRITVRQSGRGSERLKSLLHLS